MAANAPRLNQVREDRQVVGSDDVIEIATRGIFDFMEHQALAAPVASGPTQSAMPAGQGLNESGGVMALRILEAAAEAAFDFVSRDKPLVAVPTADFISHSSFKAGSKCVIRIVPNPDTKSRDKALQDQVIKDSQLYFDRASLQATNEIHEERFQLFESFDSETLFLFGERPKIWSFQFLVANSNKPTVPSALQAVGAEKALEAFMTRFNMDFCDELIRRYEKYYRGTQAARLRARTFLSFEDSLIEATLVGLTASRNSQIPGAVPVSITFVVHQRTFMGESLTFGADATLSELLASDDQQRLVTAQLQPSFLTSVRRSLDDILHQSNADVNALNDANAAALEASDARLAVARLSGDSQAELTALDAESAQLQATLDTSTSVDVIQGALQRKDDVDSRRNELRSTLQDAADLDAAISDGLTAATATQVSARAVSQVSTAQAANSSAGNLAQSPQTQAFFVDVISTLGSNRLLEIYRTDNVEDAELIAGGGPADLVGAEIVSVMDITSNPAYAGTPDGSVIRQEVVHSS